MRFGPRALEQANGKVLAHNIAGKDGRRLLRKGTLLQIDHLEQIRRLGWSQVYVAELEPGDLAEDEASYRIAQALIGEGLKVRGPSTGRTNIHTKVHGLLRIDSDRLAQVNRIPGVTVATLAADKVVPAKQLAATVKIIPYGLATDQVEQVESLATQSKPVLRLQQLEKRQVHLLLHGSKRVEQKLRDTFIPPIQMRVEAMGSILDDVQFIPFESQQEIELLASGLRNSVQFGADLIIIASETAIMDEDDLIPNAVRQAGGQVESVGAPVDPGNLLMLGYLGEIAVIGAPGCARSRKENVIDWVLPRLLVGEWLTREALIQMGMGGLLAEIKERPMPRQAIQAS